MNRDPALGQSDLQPPVHPPFQKKQRWSPLALASASLGVRPVLNKDMGIEGGRKT